MITAKLLAFSLMSNLFTPGKIRYNQQQLVLYLTPQQRHVVGTDPPLASEHPGQQHTSGGPQITGQNTQSYRSH